MLEFGLDPDKRWVEIRKE
uniref:Uncharacterized protein n=1 Tax=Lepeophtheirus salmonis TaxID=72036 RepID=A0A0K2UKY3_LEPSM